jgi:chromosome condensin MukBEF MukE localization factor
MTVKLMVDWRAREILTVKELDERIDTRVNEVMQDTELYDEYLDDYLDSNYLKKELFDALSGSDADREEILADIRSGVAEAIYDWVNMDISSDYAEVTIEV